MLHDGVSLQLDWTMNDKGSKLLAENHGSLFAFSWHYEHKYKETALLLEERKITIFHEIAVRQIFSRTQFCIGIIKSHPASCTS